MKFKFLFLFSLLLVSCGELTEIQVDMSKYHTPQLSVSSYFTADSLFSIHLSETQAAYSSGYTLPILKTASIEDLQSGKAYALKADYDEDAYIKLWTADLIPVENGKYKLLVQAEKPETTVWAEDSIPGKVPVLSATVTAIEDKLSFLGNLNFQPNPLQTVSYYEVAIYVKSYWNETEKASAVFLPEYLTSPDELITREDYYPSLILIDKENPSTLLFRLDNTGGIRVVNFEYTTETMCFYSQGIYTCSSPDHDIKIELRSVSAAYFNYKTSVYKQQYAAAGDYLYGMAEPVRVIGNVTGGEGFFGGYSKSDTVLSVTGNKNVKQNE